MSNNTDFNLSCSTCPMREQIRPGMDYWQSPCSACPLKNDDPNQPKQIIQKDNYQAERMIDFIERLLFVVSSPKRREILYIVLMNPGISNNKLAEMFEVSHQYISYHMQVIRTKLPELMGKSYFIPSR